MTKAEQARRMAWRFKVLQQACAESRNVARTCRHFGISRQAFYRWKRRYDTHGEAGLVDRRRRFWNLGGRQLGIGSASGAD